MKGGRVPGLGFGGRNGQTWLLRSLQAQVLIEVVVLRGWMAAGPGDNSGIADGSAAGSKISNSTRRKIERFFGFAQE
jgi:hypothetical protein